MKKRIIALATIPVFFLTFAIIILLIVSPDKLFSSQKRTQNQMRVVVPQFMSPREQDTLQQDSERLVWEDSLNAKIALGNGEIILAILTQDFDGDLQDEQLIAYRNLYDADSVIHITYIRYNPSTGSYQRAWNEPTMATRPGTVTISASDIIGDRSLCFIVTGMNEARQHTMLIVRMDQTGAVSRIAEIVIDGSINIRESERSQAYQMGLTRGQSHTIAAYGRDLSSANILDQIEIIYSYNPATAFYEQTRITRLPGTQVEQQRVRRILSAGTGEFEDYIGGLWYYVGPQGTLDNQQYIYFDPQTRELTFYQDEAQQVFSWLSSTSTRYGIYIGSQNISVTTLRRFVDIELESLESIKVNVYEDVRLKIGVNDTWDGSYRRADAQSRLMAAANPASLYTSGEYYGAPGVFILFPDGRYELKTDVSTVAGNYAFIQVVDTEFLELRPGALAGLPRETYLVERKARDNPEDPALPFEDLALDRGVLTIAGFQAVHEGAISFVMASRTP